MQLGLSQAEIAVVARDTAKLLAESRIDELAINDAQAKAILGIAIGVAGRLVESNNRRLEEQLRALGLIPPEA